MSLPDSLLANQFFAAAISYAGMGWQVFPVHSADNGVCTCRNAQCDSAGKHPLTCNGLKDASRETAQLQLWGEQTPQANIGVRTGRESGVWVLDIDGPEGQASLKNLEAIHGPLPKTPLSETGGGGRHYFFRWPEHIEIRSLIRIGGHKIDTRGEGGYAILPPSRHRSGREYRWLVSPDEAALAPAPQWLIEWLSSPTSKSRCTELRVVPDDFEDAEGIEQGRRHREACRLVGCSISRGEPTRRILDKARSWAERCSPPMDVAEITRIVEDLTAKNAAATIAKEVVAPAAVNDWEPFLPVERLELPPFPVDVLPDWQRDFVEQEAIATQTPPDLAGMIVIGTTATACAGKVEVRINAGYKEPLQVYATVAIGVANRKSSVFADATKPVVDYEEEEVRRLSPLIAQERAALEVEKARLEKLQAEAAKAKPDDAEALNKQVSELARQLDGKKVCRMPKLLTSDVTAEKLASLLAENGGRMAVMSPEGDAFDMMAGKYSRKPTFSVILKAHSGDDIRVDRINRAPEFVRNPALTMVFAVQPQVIQDLALSKEFRERGLLARFLYSMPASLVGRRDPDPPPMSVDVRKAYGSNMLRLLLLPQRLSDDGQPEAHELRLSPEAEQIRVELSARIEPALGPGGELEHIADWGGKLAGQVVRIAGNLHMADHASHPEPWTVPIPATTMARAVRIGGYLIPHPLAAFSHMASKPTFADAEFILRWIRRSKRFSFTRRDLFEGVKGRFAQVELLEAPLALLVSHGYLRLQASPERQGPGRPPSPILVVNPAVHKDHGGRNHPTSAGQPLWRSCSRPARHERARPCRSAPRRAGGLRSRV